MTTEREDLALRNGRLTSKKIDRLDIQTAFPGGKLHYWFRGQDGNKTDGGHELSVQLYERLQGHREDEWFKLVKAFEADPTSVYCAYWYVAQHPMFYAFRAWPRAEEEGIPLAHEQHLDYASGWAAVEVTPHMVNPANGCISDDPGLNTHLTWWIEVGPQLFRHMGGVGGGIMGHDGDLDSSAATYDEAIVKVAQLIHEHYGNDRVVVREKWDDVELPSYAAVSDSPE